MTIELTVVTHTRKNNPYPELLDRCKQSVALALPPNSQHLVLTNDLDGGQYKKAKAFSQLRYDCLKYSKYIAFVDDDDYIHPSGLSSCLNALSLTGAGVAVTNEVAVDVSGKELFANRGRRLYSNVCVAPGTIHHLTVLSSDAVSPLALELALQFGTGIEWAMKSSACLIGGGVHIPIDGAYWTQHTNGGIDDRIRNYGRIILPMGEYMKKVLPTRKGLLPTISQ